MVRFRSLGVDSRIAASVVVAAGVMTLTACSSAPSIDGVWTSDDGGASKVIDSSGACTGMYYNQGQVLDIGGPETCTLGAKSDDGSYALVVSQPPNQATYRVTFDGDTMRFTSGGKQIVLTKQ